VIDGPCIRCHAATERDGLHDIGRTWQQWLHCRKPDFQRNIKRGRGFCSICYLRNGRTWRGKDDAGLPALPFQLRKNWKRAGSRQIDQDVEALRHRDRESTARDWMNGVTVSRDHVADEFAEIDPKLARGRTVDDAEPNATIALDVHDLRGGERSIIGKEGIIR